MYRFAYPLLAAVGHRPDDADSHTLARHPGVRTEPLSACQQLFRHVVGYTGHLYLDIRAEPGKTVGFVEAGCDTHFYHHIFHVDIRISREQIQCAVYASRITGCQQLLRIRSTPRPVAGIPQAQLELQASIV
jgi:hypothetical protein